MPDGWWGPQKTSEARRIRQKRFDEAVRHMREIEKILGPQQIRLTRSTRDWEAAEATLEE